MWLMGIASLHPSYVLPVLHPKFGRDVHGFRGLVFLVAAHCEHEAAVRIILPRNVSAFPPAFQNLFHLESPCCVLLTTQEGYHRYFCERVVPALFRNS
jgi:hypothetical protein